MPSYTFRIRTVFAALMCCALFGCSATNDQAPVLGGNGRHPDSWLTGHRIAYRQNPDQCHECHGVDLKGGITKVDCFNQGAIGSCHANGHGPRAIIHAVPFKDPALHGALARKDLTICQDCHGTSGTSGSNPRFNLVYGSLAAGCESSGCHSVKMAHPKPWPTHGTSGNQANACALCHGASFEGGNGPSCRSCHSRLVGVQLPTTGSCTSCHGNPPDGTALHNRAGSHSVHLALNEVKGNCAVCHTGGGSGSAAHSVFENRTALVAMSAAYSAKSGVAQYSNSAHTCANVRCHGGQTTPVWGGALAGCMSCHASGTGQYNSFSSGKHTEHIAQGLACTDCHDTAKLAPAHFSNLSSAAFNQLPAATIRSVELGYTVQQTCSPAKAPSGSQLTVCHSGVRQW